jgi:iron complex transport system permease protein
VSAANRKRSAWGGVLLLALAAVVALILHIAAGSADEGRPFWEVRMTPIEVVQQIFAGDTGADSGNAIVWRIRLPRAIACFLVGAMLGIVGSAFQALFRNPLAEPYIVGVSSGAAVGGAIALLLGLSAIAGGLGVMAFAFAGASGSLALVLTLAGRRGKTDVQVLLLSGVVVGALLSAVLMITLYAAGEDTNKILWWLMGSATPMYWNKVAILAATLLVGAAILIPQGKKLNALAMHEETAQRLGVDTARLKLVLLLVGTAMAAVTVGSVGVIGFLGLVAPHIARSLLGVDWRWSLMGAGAIGAILLLLSDVLAQRLVAGGELPVGIITAILGAPFLLILMRRAEA